MEQIRTDVTPSLHPQNLLAIEGLDEVNSQYIASAVDAFKTAYEGIGAIHTARKAAAQNPTFTEAAALLAVADYATKRTEAITRKFDSVMTNLNKSIVATENMLTAPLENAAGHGSINSEIRTHFKNMNDADRRSFLSEANASGDSKTLVAVLGAPSYLSGMSDIEQVILTRQYHETRNPEVASRLNVMKAAHTMLEQRAPLIWDEVTKAMGSSWIKIDGLRDARKKAEQAFLPSPSFE